MIICPKKLQVFSLSLKLCWKIKEYVQTHTHIQKKNRKNVITIQYQQQNFALRPQNFANVWNSLSQKTNLKVKQKIPSHSPPKKVKKLLSYLFRFLQILYIEENFATPHFLSTKFKLNDMGHSPRLTQLKKKWKNQLNSIEQSTNKASTINPPITNKPPPPHPLKYSISPPKTCT